MKPRCRLKVLNDGRVGLPAIKFYYKKHTTILKGSSLGGNLTMRDDYIKSLAKDFIEKIDALTTN